LSEILQRGTALSRRLALLASLLGEDGQEAAAADACPRRPPGEAAPLSHGEEQLWRFDRIAPGVPAYNLAFALRFSGALDRRALAGSLAELVERHEALRCSFPERDGNPVRRIARPARPDLPQVDLSGAPGNPRWTEILRLQRELAARPFDLARGPLLRLLLVATGGREHRLLVVLHHIVADGWSVELFLRDLTVLYAARVAGRKAALEEPTQIGDVALWQRRQLAPETVAERQEYWRRKLAGLPPALALPADRPRPPAPSFRGGLLEVPLDRALASSLHGLARHLEASLFVVVLAAFKALLLRLTGVFDLAVGTPVSGRERRWLESAFGFLVNLVVLRTDLSGDPPGSEAVSRVRAVVLEAFSHQDLPFDLLVDALQAGRDRSHNPLFQVSLTLRREMPPVRLEGGLDATLEDVDNGTAKWDLMVEVIASPARTALAFHYSRDLFDRPTVLRMAAGLSVLLAGLAETPALRLAELPLLRPEERHQLLVEWNDSAAENRPESCVHELIVERARETPDALALAGAGRSLTYRQLDLGADRLASRLRRLGAGPETRIGVVMERSPEMVVALLATLKAGAAYVPLDPTHPRQRLLGQLEDAWSGSPVRLLLTDGSAGPLLPADALVLRPGEESDQDAVSVDAPSVPLLPGNAAYLIYTSGSTASPKGAVVSHRSLMGLVSWHLSAYGTGPADRATQLAAPGFDAAVWEIWSCLAAGASLHIPDEAIRTSPVALIQWLAAERITLSFLPTPLAEAALGEIWPAGMALRRLLTGGDRLHRGPRPGLPFTVYNHYGPTEGTVVTTSAPAAPEVDRPPIGWPIANTSVHVLDHWLRPVPIGVAGELAVSGVGLARGYWSRPDLTAERFLPDPYGAEPGARLYRTGDLVRRRPRGDIEFLGRIDQQVKVRGLRIELGEIEAALTAHPAVREAVVVLALAAGAAGGERLVAYVVPREEERTGGERELRAWLENRLPQPMVPASFVVLAALPLTPNGKIDRRALPAPEAPSLAIDAAPRGPIAEILAGIWAEVLGVSRVSAEDNFFELGGNSLLAMRAVSRLRNALHCDIPIRTLFDGPTVTALARRVEGALGLRSGTGTPPLARVARDRPLPLSFAQERLWFLEQLEPGLPAYNIPFGLCLAGDLDHAALAAALAEICRRHEALRTAFTLVEGAPAQTIAPPDTPSLPRVDLALLAPAARAVEVERLVAEDAVRPFDFARGHLLRATVLRLGPADHWLLVNVHHMVADGWSVGVLLRELAAFYAAFRERRSPPPPAAGLGYADFAVWQRRWLQGEALAALLAHWRTRLAGLPPLIDLPADRPRPPQQSFQGGVERLMIQSRLAGAIRSCALHEDATLFMVLLAVFQLLVSRYTGREDLAVGTPVANRGRTELEDLIGLFVNTLVLRADVSGDPDFPGFLARTRRTALDAYAYQDLPFEKLVEELQPERSLSHTPLFQVMFVVQDSWSAVPRLPGIEARFLAVDTATSKLDLTMVVEAAQGDLQVSATYCRDLFDRATISRLLRHFRNLLEGATAGPGTRLSALSLLTPAERFQLLSEWNQAGNIPLAARCAHELIAAQAARTPESTALVCGRARRSYRELARQVGRLARRLRELGVGPEKRVGICLDRSPEMVVALLATWNAGGAYVPLDPTYPPERLRWILEDSRVTVLLTREELLATFAPARHVDHTLCLRSATGAHGDDADLPGQGGAGAFPDNLAYVIYTSGSTGRPKGVAITHRSVTALLLWAREVFSTEELRGVFASTSIGFDLSVFELFVPLAWGGTVILGQDALALAESPPQQEGCETYGLGEVTLVNTVPSAISELLRLGAIPESARTVTLAGEPLRRDLVDRLHALPGVHRVLNLYGPSEDTTYSTFAELSRGGIEPAIGRPVSGTRAYLLDPHLVPVPVGVPGEICLGGAGLARGYLGRPDLTAERFVPDPHAATAGERLYRTGDLARYRPNGEIEFIGRLDHQVKLRGFRVELGEIEAALRRLPGVRESAVLVWGEGADRRLVAYVTGPPVLGQGDPAAELRALLARELPAYMVPADFMLLDGLPLTPNGKVDRRALPAPRRALGASPLRTPATPVAELLAEIWTAVLGVEGVGLDDDFFALGGHSLKAARVAARLQSLLGVDVPVRTLFEAPTLAGLVRRIEELRGAVPAAVAPPVPVPRGGALPLSFSQQGLWLLEQLDPTGATYNVAAALRLAGALDVPSVAAALDEIVRRHEILRATFPMVGAAPVQTISSPARRPLPVVDLTGLAAAGRPAHAERLAREEARRRFDLARGPLLRFVLVRLEERQHLLALVLHHIVADAWSMGVLLHELSTLYGSIASGRSSLLPELPLQYADFAVWQREALRGEILEEKLAYWKRALAGAPRALELPADRPRPAVRTFRGSSRPIVLPPALTRAAKDLSRREGNTLFITLLAAFATVLHRCSGQDEVVVGCPMANRAQEATEQLIGPFVNVLPLRISLAGRPAYRELLSRVRRATLAGFDHQDVPFEKIVAAVQPRPDATRAALRQVGFAFHNDPLRRLTWPGGIQGDLLELELRSGGARLDLTLFLWESSDELHGICEYAADLFAASTIDRFVEFFRGVVEDMAGGAERSLLALPPMVEPRPGAEPAAQSTQRAGAGGEESNLTASQLLFWFAQALSPEVPLYFRRATATFTLEGALDVFHFQRAFQKLIEASDALRTRITADDGVPRARVTEYEPSPLDLVDLSVFPDPGAVFSRWLAKRMRVPPDIAEQAFDSALVRLSDRRFVWFWSVDHIVADAWSIALLARRLSELYELSLQGRLDQARPLPSFARYAERERSQRQSAIQARARAYWDRKLAVPCARPTFYRRDPASRTTLTTRVTVDLGEERSRQVQEAARRQGFLSPAVVFATALFACLRRLGAEGVLRIGTPFNNRRQESREVVGLLMNACPLQVEIAAGETFASLARKVQSETVDTARFQFHPIRNPMADPVYEVYLNFQTVTFPRLCGLPAAFELLHSGHSYDALDLQVRDFEECGRFRLDFDCNRGAFDAEQAARCAGHYLNLLAALLDRPEQRIDDAELLTPAEREHVLVELNRTAASYDRSRCLHHWIEAQAALTPEAPAVTDGQRSWTYHELDHRANRVARHLRALGVERGDCVGICAERSLVMVAGLLGILKAGGAYLPLDPTYPAARLAWMVEEARCPVLAGQEKLLGRLPASGARTLCLDRADDPVWRQSGDRLATELDENDLAYVIYTSGSTGRPKGVMVPHRGVVNRLLWMQEAFGLTHRDRVLQKTPFGFDVSVWEFFWPLMTGAMLVMARPGGQHDPAYLIAAIREHGISTVHFVPSMLQLFLDHPDVAGCRSLARVIASGEALPESLGRRFHQRLGAELHNLYGPTEASIDVTAWRCARGGDQPAAASVPIGHPIANTQIYLLDRRGHPVPVGIAGELYIGGANLARGYLQRPELTAERFLPHPCGRMGGERLYATGDLARHLPDGAIEFLGRLDHQVKVRGVRVELSEIEAVITRYPGVREAVVVAREDRPGERRLAAYLVTGAAEAPSLPELRAFLAAELPDAMLPAAVVRLAAMPLGPNGKIDRQALPAPAPAPASAERGAVSRRTPLEALLASIFAEVLELEDVGLEDGFFELGGDSLRAMRVAISIRELLPVDLPVLTLFEEPTVAGVARFLEAAARSLGTEQQRAMSDVLTQFEALGREYDPPLAS
jgi:amino acid adenylation domain-containing protein